MFIWDGWCGVVQENIVLGRLEVSQVASLDSVTSRGLSGRI